MQLAVPMRLVGDERTMDVAAEALFCSLASVKDGLVLRQVLRVVLRWRSHPGTPVVPLAGQQQERGLSLR